MKIWAHSGCVSMMMGLAHRLFISTILYPFISLFFYFSFIIMVYVQNNISQDTIGIQMRPKDEMCARVRHKTYDKQLIWLVSRTHDYTNMPFACFFGYQGGRRAAFLLLYFFLLPVNGVSIVEVKNWHAKPKFVFKASDNWYAATKSKWQKKTRDERENEKAKS